KSFDHPVTALAGFDVVLSVRDCESNSDFSRLVFRVGGNIRDLVSPPCSERISHESSDLWYSPILPQGESPARSKTQRTGLLGPNERGDGPIFVRGEKETLTV